MKHYGFKFAWFGILLAVFTSDLCGNGNESDADYEFSADIDHIQLSGKTLVYRLEDVRPGEIKTVKVHLRNISSIDVPLEEVSAPCKCTTAKVPRITLKPGEETTAFFVLSTNSNPRDVNEKLSLTIHCGDKAGVIPFSFHVAFRETVVFTRPAAHFFFVEDSKELTFDLPLASNSKELFEGLKVESSKELSFLEHRIEVDDSNAILKFSFKPFSDYPKGIDQVSGEVSVVTKRGFRSTILCTITKETLLEVMPDLLIFSRSDSTDGSRQATAMLKVRAKPNSRPSALSKANCFTQENKQLTCVFKQLGRDIYRLRVDLPVDVQLHPKSHVIWEFALENGQVFEVKSKVSRPN
jgi:hypothetical protein